MSDLEDDGYNWLYYLEGEYDDMEAMFRNVIREKTVSYIDTYGKMPFLEELFVHGYFPYDKIDEFDWFSVADWQKVTRYLGTGMEFR